jgi:hypothetical protein
MKKMRKLRFEIAMSSRFVPGVVKIISGFTSGLGINAVDVLEQLELFVISS